MALVSIVIPCYNQARFLPDCIDSLRLQSLSDWEAIIVNDGSTDNTGEMAARLCEKDSRVRYIEQSNGGLSCARNSGVKQARGAFLQFLDSDDMLDSRKLEIHVEYLERNPEIGIVYGDARYFTTENLSLRECGPYSDESGRPWIPTVWHAPGLLLSKLLTRNITPVNCPLIRRGVMERVGPWSEALRALEDWEYWVRCAAAGVNFGYCDSSGSLALIRMHPSSMTKDSRRMAEALLEFRLSTAKYFSLPGDALLSAARSAYAADSLDADERSVRYLRIIHAHANPEALLAIVRAYFRVGREGSRRSRALRLIWRGLPVGAKAKAILLVRLGSLPLLRQLF